MRSRSEGYNLRKALFFGLLGGCFTSLVSITVSGGLVAAGLASLAPISDTIHWVLATFGVSSLLTVLAILALESFCEP
jgi:C4-dicarboxylate transporter